MKPPAATALAIRLQRWQTSIISFLVAHESLLLWLGISLFVLFLSAIGAWKLWSFGYNGFDLAIHRQVVEHSLRGDWFGFSLHPNKYIGDHFSPAHALLWPLYAIWKHPLTLIILQNIALALAVLPLAKIGAKLVGKPWHLLFVFAYLVNPIVHNMALFEFHLLPFAILILMLASLAYIQKNYWRFFVWCLLCLTIREDASLPIIGFGLLALVDRRHWRWSIVPIVLGLSWLWFATTMTTIFGGYEDYKFLYYYSWLGNSFSDILRTIVTKPWLVLLHILRPSTVSLAFVLLAPFAFLPALRGRWLVPAIPVLGQILLMGTGTILVQTHYPSFILPFLFIAAVAAWKSIKETNIGVTAILHRNLGSTAFLVAGTIIYSSMALGPILQSIPVIAQTKKISDRVRAERAMVQNVPPGGIISSMETLVDLSNRPGVYSLHYAFLGHRQFSSQPYAIPDDAQTVILDQRDFLFYQLLYPPETEDHKTGYRRLRELIDERGFNITENFDRFSLLEKNLGSAGTEKLYTKSSPADLRGTPSQHDELSFLGWSTSAGKLATEETSFFGQRFNSLPISLTFTKNNEVQTLYQLEFSFQHNDAVVYRYQTTFGGGLYPTCDWPAGESVASHYTILIPSWLPGQSAVTVRVLNLAGGIGLNGARSTVPIYNTFETIGPIIELGRLDV